MFKKVQTKKVYMKIVEQIRDLIKDGKLRPGDKLPPEYVLAEQFGTSRPSIREALSALEILGIIESRGGKGNFIRDNLNSVFYEQKFKELEEEKSPFELLEAGLLTNIPEVMESDREFHISIAKAAHNSILFSMMSYLADGLKEKLWVNLKEKSWSIPGRPQKYLEEHIQIFDAIKNKDSTTASSRMYHHLAEVEKDLLRE